MSLGMLPQTSLSACRRLFRDPRFALSAILSLAAGLAICLSVVRLVNRLVLVDVAGVPKPAQLRRMSVVSARLDAGGAAVERGLFSYPEWEVILSRLPPPGAFASYSDAGAVMARSEASVDRLRLVLVSREYFHVMGVVPRLGRFLSFSNEGAHSEVVLSYRAWHRYFGGSVKVLGRELQLHGRTFAIVGVAPEGFDGVDFDGPDMWVRWDALASTVLGADWRYRRDSYPLRILARLPADADIRSRLERTRIGLNSESEATGGADKYLALHVLSLADARRSEIQQETNLAWVFLVLGFCCFFATCLNLGCLFLLRTMKQQRILSTAEALGATRWRLAADRIVECLVVAGCACLIGWIASMWGGRLIGGVVGSWLRWTDTMFDWRILAIATALALPATMLAGCIPFVLSRSVSPLRGMKSSDAGSPGLARRVLLVHRIQLGIVGVLVFVALQFVFSSQRAGALPLGIVADDVVIVSMGNLTLAGDEPGGNDRLRRVLGDLNSVASIRAGAVASTAPLYAVTMSPTRFRPALPDEAGVTEGPFVNAVTEAYFEVLGIPLVAGRAFASSEGARTEAVAVINDIAAKQLGGPEAAIDRYVAIGGDTTWRRIIGVVKSSVRMRLGEAAAPQVFLPLLQVKSVPRNLYIIARSKHGGFSRAAADLLEVGVRFAGGEGRVLVAALSTSVDRLRETWLRAGRLLVLLAALSIGGSIAGLYATQSYEFRSRQKEWGIRLALGAAPSKLRRLAVGDGWRISIAGLIVAGLGCAWANSALKALLFDPPQVPFVSAMVTATLIAVAGPTAGLIAAWKIDAIAAIRGLSQGD